MFKKKLASLVAAGSLLVSTGVSTTVLADNHGDTSWHNEYRVWSPNDHTPARKKTNRTSYYNKTNSTHGNVGYITIWAALYDGRDASGGHNYRSYAGTTTFLWNNAVENHGSGISVRIDSSSWSDGSADGVWSPDSI
ncbi:hypothetical protein AUQ39_13060 [Lacticaseibacillus casei]|jgi:hypothetical protein|uniref:Lactococcin 972 family bacteriocin n=1 Tax=Lacticaseibacillus zeae TaxID=57037 RepID=A0A5R8LUR1_LACZE|nr:hypothetical protein [Lacticaseibacillus zeae]OLS04969.1 hypothetical protein AUQ39_13060 [Lacticaseibacillus casei]QVI31830.1 hypothetical protein KG087_13290 [Lacticaseibacillus zeae]TLF40853.1 hypothetical protein FEI14_09305 [Lacticaseibacillus zeae]